MDSIQALAETTLAWFRTTFENKVRLDTLRSLPQFLGISAANGCFAPEAYGAPVKHLDKSTMEKIKSRVSLNLAYFLTNYVLVVFLVATVVALMHPGMILFVGVLYGLWTAHTAWGYKELLLFGVELHRYLTFPMRFKILTALTLVVVVWKCWWPMIHAIIISTFLIASHALLRDPKQLDGSIEDNGEEEYTGPLVVEGKDEEGGLSSSESSAVFVERPTS